MKNSTRKIINHLSKYIGLEVIRTKPTQDKIGDWSMTSAPIIILGFTEDGCIKYRYSGFNKLYLEIRSILYQSALQTETGSLIRKLVELRKMNLTSGEVKR